VEIYNNTFTGGSIDFNETRSGLNTNGGRNYAGAQSYGAWIHDNTFNLGAPNSGHWTPAIQLEFYSEDIIIERNTITITLSAFCIVEEQEMNSEITSSEITYLPI